MYKVGAVLWSSERRTLMRPALVANKLYCSEEQWHSNDPGYTTHAAWDDLQTEFLELAFGRTMENLNA